MPQLENGYLKIANELWDAICGFRIPGEARQIFDFILRKTYGYQKKYDNISLSQFEEGTGLSRSSVCRGIKKLVTMNLIDKKETRNVTSYGINKVYRTWRGVTKTSPQLPKGKSGSDEKVNQVVTKKRHTKETITKDNTTKDKYSAVFLNFYEKYPVKKSKHEAQKAWKKLKPTDALIERILLDVENRQNDRQWLKGYIPHPSTYLNKRVWEDDIESVGSKKKSANQLRIEELKREAEQNAK